MSFEVPTAHGYTRTDWLTITGAALCLLPFVTIVFLHAGPFPPIVVAGAVGLGIVSAAFMLSWATEGMENVVPQSIALAVLALIEIAPEYTFEIYLAFTKQTQLASASMTGANRLLLGLGWPLILFIAFFAARRKGQRFTEIRLDARNAPELFFLLIATLYAFVIVAKRSLSLLDSGVLLTIYALYVIVAFRSRHQPGSDACADDDDHDDDDVGVAARTKALRGGRKVAAIGAFLVVGAVTLYLGAEPFIRSMLATAKDLGVSQFVLIQWVAPFLSEFPESLTAFIWAATVVLAGKGMSNLISSKLNQWTLLIAAIPIAYSLGLGRLATVPLTPQSETELFLTAAQSAFGIALLLNFRFGLREATALSVLFLIQFFIPIEPIRMVLAWLYLVATALVLWRTRKEVHLISVFRSSLQSVETSMKSRTSYLVFVEVVALTVLIADQLIKGVVAANFALGESRIVIPRALYWTYIRNSHGAFGLFGDNRLVLVGLSLAVMVVFWHAFRDRLRTSRLAQCAFGAIVGGGISNLVDRFRHAYVVDFIDLRWWPVFNLADVSITVGTLLLLLHAWRKSNARPENNRAP